MKVIFQQVIFQQVISLITSYPKHEFESIRQFQSIPRTKFYFLYEIFGVFQRFSVFLGTEEYIPIFEEKKKQIKSIILFSV